IARWVALGGGLSYGYVHARTLRKEADVKRIEKEYERKVALIQEAKKKFAESKSTSDSSSEKFNFEDPNFDADKWFRHVEAKFK
ncbi:hypothetical protein LPJ56_001184, partial [Coemansia sp. RSA 2599]